MQKWGRINYTPNLPLGENGERVTASQKHIDISKEVAKEGMVLLKNNDNVLPLKKGSRVVLFGKGTFDYVKGGGGSGDTTVAYIRNLYEGMKMLKDRVDIYEPVADYYRENIKKQYEAGKEPGMTVEPPVPADLMGSAKNYSDTAIISICRFSGEGWDRFSGKKIKADTLTTYDRTMLEKMQGAFAKSDFYLTDEEQAMVDEVKMSFDKVIVVMNVGGMVDTTWFAKDDLINSVLMTWQAGMEGGLATAELLTGIGNPSGKLSDTFAGSLDDYPSTEGFHESVDYVDYNEDIYVGYRYFETISGANDKVVYPFGYGLSYTSFVIRQGDCYEENGIVKAEVTVTNTGDVAGKEVVQLYASAPQGVLGKPAIELKDFVKTRLLMPGESQIITLSVNIDNLASYDDLGKIAKAAYVLEKGEYRFFVGNSARNICQTKYVYKLDEDRIVTQLTSRLVPTALKKRMLSDGSYEDLPTGPSNNPNESVCVPFERSFWEGSTPIGHLGDGHSLWKTNEELGRIPLSYVYEGKASMKDFLAQLTDEQLMDMVGGQDNTGCANTFGIGNLHDYGVPNAMTADGPAGLRIKPEVGVVTTAFPCATLIACTWNPEAAYEVGRTGAKEVKENNIAMWLTPAINIHRSPLCGRNFEYYSEDPFLTGKMAAAMVRGIQSMHISASVKHFAFNNKETNRNQSDSRVSERAAREIYLKAFEIIVKEADPWCIMSSYNIINGHRASECKDLLTHILREEWGYKGLVTTDWWNPSEQYKELLAGNDVKMPTGYPYRLKEVMDKGVITREVLEESVTRILELIMKFD